MNGPGSSAGDPAWRSHLVLILCVWVPWALMMAYGDQWRLFEHDWYMSVTMMFGSFVAGATSEGGGAVAFPVMTLGFDLSPQVARDFSLMIQSVGMSAAAVMIVLMRIRVEWRAVVFAGLGGLLGVVVGLEQLSRIFPATYTKTFFVSFWLGFGAALYWINRDRARHVFTRIPSFDVHAALKLFVAGVLGGLVSGLTGSGLDIVAFSLLVLWFGLCEKVATPTSVVLMATNSLAGFAWREGVGDGMLPQAWDFWWVCVPIVVVGAPLGARFIRDRSRHFVSGFLYLSIVAQYLWALVVIPQTGPLLLFSVLVILGSVSFFVAMTRNGRARTVATPSA